MRRKVGDFNNFIVVFLANKESLTKFNDFSKWEVALCRCCLDKSKKKKLGSES